MSTKPSNWPFSSYLDLDALRAEEQELGMPHISTLLADSLQFMEDFLHGTTLFTRPFGYKRITVGLTATWWMGARSRRTDPPSGYAISIDAGTLIQLHMALSRVLAHPEVLKDQADCPMPALDQPLALPRLRLRVELEEEYLFEGDPRAPKRPEDAKRASCHRQLLFYGMQFLFLHELAHIVQGHIEYRIRRSGDCAQLSSEERERAITKDFHALEYLADARATVWAMYLAWLGALSRDSGRQHIEDQLRLCGFSAGLVFLLTECFDEATGDPHRHPLAADRRLFIRAAPAGSLIDFGEIDRHVALEAFSKGIDEAEIAWDALGWKRYSASEIDADGFIEWIKNMAEKLEAPADM